MRLSQRAVIRSAGGRNFAAVRVSGPASGNVGDWTLVSGGGTLANSTVNDGQATYTFAAGGESSVVFGLKVTPPNQVVNVSVSDGNATDVSGTASADAGYNQDLTFVPAGLRISNAAGAARRRRQWHRATRDRRSCGRRNHSARPTRRR